MTSSCFQKMMRIFLNAHSLFQVVELSSRLKINMPKSGFAGINVDFQTLHFCIISRMSNFGVLV